MNSRLILSGTVVSLLFISSFNPKVPGCTDPMASNYNSSATDNDGSCIYDPVTISPVETFQLDGSVYETSGLTLWNDLGWTHNDNTDTRLYGISLSGGEILTEVELLNVENRDWEEISQDADYLYIGDIGNNAGNRTDLRILRIQKEALTSGRQVIDTIWYSYGDQADFSTGGGQQTDFDCEAFVVSEDSIYLFTKQWISPGTSVYKLPKIPGTFTAVRVGWLDIQGLVTGAVFLEKENLLVLVGYSASLYPFFHLSYGFRGHDFFSANNRQVVISLPFHQVESVSTVNGLDYYVTNERTMIRSAMLAPPKLHRFDLRALLEGYLQP